MINKSLLVRSFFGVGVRVGVRIGVEIVVRIRIRVRKMIKKRIEKRIRIRTRIRTRIRIRIRIRISIRIRIRVMIRIRIDRGTDKDKDRGKDKDTEDKYNDHTYNNINSLLYLLADFISALIASSKVIVPLPISSFAVARVSKRHMLLPPQTDSADARSAGSASIFRSSRNLGTKARSFIEAQLSGAL